MSDAVAGALNGVELSTEQDVIDWVRSGTGRLPVAGQTKPSLHRTLSDLPTPAESQLGCLKSMSGVIEYEPSEFTFTARAATPLREVVAMLAEKNQYLPFDPLLVHGGATLGGTVASGLSGPGRYRFGG
ncbi:MAG: FAD-binding protein, partial [Planctomycetota bacterium]